MGKRTITECDRCGSEIKGVPFKGVTVQRSGETRKLDICVSCDNKLSEFLGGTELEEDP